MLRLSSSRLRVAAAAQTHLVRSTSTALPPEWTKLAVEDLAGKPVESLVWNSPEGIPIKPLYTADDTKPLEVQQIPGEFARRIRRPALTHQLRFGQEFSLTLEECEPPCTRVSLRLALAMGERRGGERFSNIIASLGFSCSTTMDHSSIRGVLYG